MTRIGHIVTGLSQSGPELHKLSVIRKEDRRILEILIQVSNFQNKV